MNEAKLHIFSLFLLQNVIRRRNIPVSSQSFAALDAYITSTRRHLTETSAFRASTALHLHTQSTDNECLCEYTINATTHLYTVNFYVATTCFIFFLVVWCRFDVFISFFLFSLHASWRLALDRVRLLMDKVKVY